MRYANVKMFIPQTLISLLSLAVIVGFAPNAVADVLTPGKVLQISFSTTGPVCPGGSCDVLELLPFESGSFFATNVTAKLFDGMTLLGTYFNPTCCAPVFHSPSSLFQEGTSVDFTAIDSGLSNGVLDMSIETGFLTWPSNPTPELLIGHGIGPGSVVVGSGLQINSVAILPTPEPSSIGILIGGIVFLVWRKTVHNRHTP